MSSMPPSNSGCTLGEHEGSTRDVRVALIQGFTVT